jgi:hypothetical protein
MARLEVIVQERLFPLAPPEFMTLLFGFLLQPPIRAVPVLGSGVFGLLRSISHDAGLRLWEQAEPPQIIVGPAGALKNLSDGFWAEGIVEVMIHKQHPASIRVLVDMVGAAGFSAAEALVFDGPDPFPGGAVP